jgi:hypothetical protein
MTLQDMWHETADVEELMAIGDLQELAGLGAIAMEPRTPAQESKDMMALLRLALKDGCSMVFTYGEGTWEAFEVVPWLAIEWGQWVELLSPDNHCIPGSHFGGPLLMTLRGATILAEEAITERTEMSGRRETGKETEHAISKVVERLGDLGIYFYIYAQVKGQQFSLRTVAPQSGSPLQADHQHYSQAESFEMSRKLAEGNISMGKIHLLRYIWENIAQATVGKSLEECAAGRLLRLTQPPGEITPPAPSKETKGGRNE